MLYQGLKAFGEVCKLHHLRPIDQFRPLQIAVRLRRKMPKKRMVRMRQKADRVRRAHLKPRGIPKNRRQLLFDVAAVFDFSGGKQQDFFAAIQPPHRFVVEAVANKNRSLSKPCGGRIHPEIPVVDKVRTVKFHFQIQLACLRDLRQWCFYRAYLKTVADRNICRRKNALRNDSPRAVRNLPTDLLIGQRFFSEMIDFDLRTETFVVGINKFFHARQRHGFIAKSAKLCSGDIGFFVPKNV